MKREMMVEFLEWLKRQTAYEESISWSNVELSLIDDCMGYGLFAKEDIRPDEILLKIPARFLITSHLMATIPEYVDILGRFCLDSAESLALFFAFERVYFDNFCEQTSTNGSGGGSHDGIAYFVEWTLERPRGFERFLNIRKANAFHGTADALWWKSYISVLPRNFATPLFQYYLDEDVDEKIRRVAEQIPQQVKDKLIGQLAELKSFEKKFFKILFDEDEAPLSEQMKNLDLGEIANEKGFPEIGNDSFRFWKEICLWAWHTVNTRSIFVDNFPVHPLADLPPKTVDENEKNAKVTGARLSGRRKKKEMDLSDYGGSLALVPLLDMLNHRPDAQCVPTWDKNSNSYILRAVRHVNAGQQLFICYGAHDNARLWIEYGFRMDENPFNRVNLPIDLFIKLAERCGLRVSTSKREILVKADLPCTIYATDDIPSYALRKNCSILLMSKEKLSNWSRHIFGPESEEDEDHRAEMDLLKEILARLMNALMARREGCEDVDLQSFWTDQIQILQGMIANLKISMQ